MFALASRMAAAIASRSSFEVGTEMTTLKGAPTVAASAIAPAIAEERALIAQWAAGLPAK